MAHVLVRDAREEDAERVAEVHVRSWQVAYEHVFGEDRLASLSVAQRVSVVRSWLAHPERGALLVAEVGGAVAGFCSAGAANELGPDVGEVYAIYADPGHWDLGVGRALMVRTLEVLRERGYAEAVLWVLDDNPRARRFYEAGGWRLDGGRRAGEHLGVRTVELRYRIDLGR